MWLSLVLLSVLLASELSKVYDSRLRKIPFSSNDSVQVSVLLRAKGGKTISDTLSRGHTKNFIGDLIVVVREKGTWKIKQFNVADTAIAEMYNDVRQSIDINTYTEKTTDGFRLKDSDINFQTLTPIDKRLLQFSLYRIKKSLDLPDTNDKGVSLTYPSL